jgi:predicted nucleotidyltransferase
MQTISIGREHKNMDKRVQQYIEASKVYIDQEKLNEDVIGIIVSGSIVHSRLDKNSDIDIQVILSPDCDYRERGNTWIDGIEIEYFKNPPAQISTYLEREKARPLAAHMLAHGHIAYNASPIIDELVAAAGAIIDEAPPALTPHELAFEKYFLDDYYKDLEDAQINKDVLGTSLIRHKIINRCIDVFCKAHRVRRGKDKRIEEQLRNIDPAFITCIAAALSEPPLKTGSITTLRIATERLLGGARSKEWKLRSGLDLM